DLLDAVVRQYYFAILSGSIEVVLEDNSAEVHLSSVNLVETVRAELPEFAEAVELARWALSAPATYRLTLNSPEAEGPQKWSAGLVPEAVREGINSALASRERVAVRVPLYVRKTQGEI